MTNNLMLKDSDDRHRGTCMIVDCDAPSTNHGTSEDDIELCGQHNAQADEEQQKSEAWAMANYGMTRRQMLGE